MFANSKDNKTKHFNFFWNRFKQQLSWCFERTNIHGFQFVVNANISVFARFFFAVISGCSLVLGVLLIVLQMFDYYDAFIVTRVVTANYPVWRLRFPAVTVCSYNAVYKNNIKKIRDVVMPDNTVEPELFNEFIDNLPLLIYNNLHKNNKYDNYTKIQGILEKRGYNIDKVMAQLAHPCKSMIKKCFWQGSEISCRYLIHSVKTNQGYCCSFNYYGTDNAIKDMIDPYNEHYTYSTLSNPVFGLRLLLDIEKDQYVSTIKPLYGLNILVQDGADFPDMHWSANTLQTSEELKISVSPDVYVGTQNLRNINPEKRGCLFEDESNIGWSSIYSYKTCVRQCKGAATYEFCNCTPFHYPLKEFRRVCTLSDVPCLRLYKYNFTAVLIDEHSELTVNDAQKIDPYFSKSVRNCTCYAQCNARIYNSHISKAKITSSKKTSWYINQNLSILNVYYSDSDCTQIERDVYYTWDRILASIGGIFNLCLGGSIISIVQCFYSIGKLISVFVMKPTKERVFRKNTTCRVQKILIEKKKNKRENMRNKHIRTGTFIKAFGKQP